MVMKNGKAWGKVWEDGYSTEYGWMNPDVAPIHNPEYVKNPTDVTYKGSRYIKELSKAKLVNVERRTEVIINMV